MRRVKRAQKILRVWDAIGIAPGEYGPSDEYDSYAPSILSMLARGTDPEELHCHLKHIRTDVIGIEANLSYDLETASAILNVL